MKRKLALIALLMLFCGITGCARNGADETADGQLQASENGQIPVASRLEGDGGLEDLKISHLLQDVLYYCVADYTGDGTYLGSSVYRRSRQGEAVMIADFGGQGNILIHFLVDENSNIYYLYLDTEDHYKVYLRKDDKAGNTIYCVEADSQEGVQDEAVMYANVRSWTGLRTGAADAQGVTYFQDTAGRIRIFDEYGNETGVIEPQEEPTGKTGLVNAGEEGIYSYDTYDGKVVLRKVNAEIQKMSAPMEVRISDKSASVQVMNGYSQGILLSTRDTLWAFHPSSEELTQVLNWADPKVNLSGDYVNHAAALDGGGFFVVAADSNTGEIKRILIEEKNADEIPARTSVTMGVRKGGISEEALDYVAAFNEKSEEFQIEIKYYEYNGQEELYKELLKGQGPDLIDLSFVDMNILAYKGVLEDLNPYLERSKEVKKEDLISGIVTGGTIDGKLVSVCHSFYIWALAIPEGWSENHGWTPERMLKMGYAYPDSNIIASSNHLNFLFQYILPVAVDGFIDWENKECSFDSERFIGLLNDIKGLELEPNQSNSYTSKEGFFKKDYLMCNVLISSPDTYADAAHALEGTGELVGYPESEGKPHFLMLSNCTYGINSASQQKEGAWAFLEYLLSRKFQDSHSGINDSWPVRRDAFENRLLETAEKNYPLDTEVKGIHQNSFTFELEDRYPKVTEKDIEMLRFIVDNAYLHKNASSGESSYNYQNIILEEAGGFFQGAKTAEETAEIIQNRMSLFLRE